MADAAPPDAIPPADGSPCSAGDADRVFWNDFEDGRFYAAQGMTYDPSRDFYDVRPAQFGVVGSSVMPPFDGNKVLRGNFWETGTVTPMPDPVAEKAGITILGARQTYFAVDLTKLGISQTPSPDPKASPPAPGELYVSFWLWYDADFSHEARWPGSSTTITQYIKLFYAFGPSGVEWVQTDAFKLAMNINNLGAWPSLPWVSRPKLEGKWSHVEWYFKSESHPVFYEYGEFSNGTFLASACNPRPPDWTVAFPVPGSNPMVCTPEADAYAANSKDGIYRMKLDGNEVYPAQTNMAWNGRFDRINFPAYHGGGGDPIASAGWAIDDVCLRRSAPAGF